MSEELFVISLGPEQKGVSTLKNPNKVKKKDLQRHRCLEELGLERRDCGTNFAAEKKWMQKEQRKYGFDRRETYDLGPTFAQWLYEHLRMFLDVGGVVDSNAARRNSATFVPTARHNRV